jgi:hypothetical protein
MKKTAWVVTPLRAETDCDLTAESQRRLPKEPTNAMVAFIEFAQSGIEVARLDGLSGLG